MARADQDLKDDTFGLFLDVITVFAFNRCGAVLFCTFSAVLAGSASTPPPPSGHDPLAGRDRAVGGGEEAGPDALLAYFDVLDAGVAFSQLIDAAQGF